MKSPTPAELLRAARNPNRALSVFDSETHTLGCRHGDPGMCKAHLMTGYCAFARADGVCSNPPRNWKMRYARLARRRAQARMSSTG